MEQKDPDLPKLSKNEQLVLKNIIEQAKIPDLEIAKKMRISQQAVFKIRHKLEEAGIIKGYIPVIDYKKIGIRTLVLLGVKFSSVIWSKYSEEEVAASIQAMPQVIICYRIPESEISHLLVIGFKNLEEKERYMMRLQTKFSKEMEIVHTYSFSVDRIIKNSQVGLLHTVLDKKIFPLKDFFFD